MDSHLTVVWVVTQAWSKGAVYDGTSLPRRYLFNRIFKIFGCMYSVTDAAGSSIYDDEDRLVRLKDQLGMIIERRPKASEQHYKIHSGGTTHPNQKQFTKAHPNSTNPESDARFYSVPKESDHRGHKFRCLNEYYFCLKLGPEF